MKNVIITGGNSGLGFETAKKIAANKDYKIILACRNAEKGESAKQKIIAETGNENVESVSLDVSSLESVRAFAGEFAGRGEKIYALVNNAGISSMGNSGVTKDGFDLVIETNYLGHFLLTQLLLPYIEDGGRIYSVSSDMHNPPRGELVWTGAENILRAGGESRQNYSFSKLFLIYMTHVLSQKLKESGKNITANAFNPGFMGDTNFMKAGKISGAFVKHAMADRYGDLDKSSSALAQLVTGEEFAQISGEYFDRSVNTAKSSPLSYNDGNAKELWETSLKCVNLEEPSI